MTANLCYITGVKSASFSHPTRPITKVIDWNNGLNLEMKWLITLTSTIPVFNLIRPTVYEKAQPIHLLKNTNAVYSTVRDKDGALPLIKVRNLGRPPRRDILSGT